MDDRAIPQLTEERRHRAAGVMKALGHPDRLRIVEVVVHHGEVTVGDLARLCDLEQPIVSHHAAVLRRAGIVEVRRQGTRRYHRLAHERFIKLLECIASCKPEEGDIPHE